MTINRYIVLTNSDSSLSKRFKVVSMQPTLNKTESSQRTISGKLDKANGAIVAIHPYTIRVKANEDDSDYGTKDNLETFFKYNNPQGTPSDTITLTDHYGDTHDCKMMGSLATTPVTTMLEGASAIFMYNIMLEEIEPV